MHSCSVETLKYAIVTAISMSCAGLVAELLNERDSGGWERQGIC